MTFVLNEKLASDSAFIVDLPLCQARLSHNAAFPWVILIPRLFNAVEIIDLSQDHQFQLLKEINQVSKVVRDLFQPTKLNVVNLGNVVSQLHVHVIARYDSDLAWPQPVWNSGVFKPYDEAEKTARLSQIASILQG